MTKKEFTLTQDSLKDLLHYDPDTGIFTWIVNRGGGARSGDTAGYSGETRGKKYFRTEISGKAYLLHRLAYLYMTGKWPDNEIDHDDGNGLNNKWDNIGPATRVQNSKNMRKSISNKSGVTGVYLDKERNKWCVQINFEHRQIKLGRFEAFNDAVIARKMAEYKYNYHKNHGSVRPL